MKLALRQLIEDVNRIAQGLNEDELLEYFNKRAKELLQVTKTQMLNMYDAGNRKGYEEHKLSAAHDLDEEYFNEVYDEGN